MLDKIVSSLYFSFVSIFVGWLAGDVATVICSGILSGGDVIHFVALVGTFSAIPVLLVWAAMLWPLFWLVPATSPMWRLPICTTCGAVAGGLLALAAWPLYGEFGAFLLTAPLIGGVTCAVGCRVKAFEQTAQSDPAPSPR